MAYLATCTFDLKGASRTDYENAYADLAKVGLTRAVVRGSGKTVVAPTTMTIGEFTGVSVDAVRDFVRDKVIAAFKARRFTSEIFIVVGASGTWGAATT
jgi:hypothetical protein